MSCAYLIHGIPELAKVDELDSDGVDLQHEASPEQQKDPHLHARCKCLSFQS